MASKDPSTDAIKQQILALDDQIETLVMSIDPAEPESHAAVYAQIEALHATIFALRADLKRQEAAADKLH